MTRELTKDQIPRAAAVLGRAFYDDPLQNYFFPDDADRDRLGPVIFEPMVRFAQANGKVLTTEDVDAAALWFPPGKRAMSDEAAASAGMNDLPAAIGVDTFTRFVNFFAAIEPYHERDAHDDHWYLAVLGVDPPRQGQGVGRSLIAPILELADAAGVACYLETAQPNNVPFYVNQGFDLLVDEVEPVSGVRFWTFRRHAPA